MDSILVTMGVSGQGSLIQAGGELLNIRHTWSLAVLRGNSHVHLFSFLVSVKGVPSLNMCNTHVHDGSATCLSLPIIGTGKRSSVVH